MRLVLLVAAGAAVLLIAVWFAGVTPFGRAQAATLHIDYEHGRDDRDGLTPATAWKHAPGDPKAQGLPARTTLHPGDVVTFAANVRYRGMIAVTASGKSGAPIVFTGATPDASAVIDGSEPALSVTPCQSAQDCGGADSWRKLVKIQSAEPLGEGIALFTDTGALRPAQAPDPKDAFYRDEEDDMAEADGGEMEGGRVHLPHAVAAGLASGGGRLAMWVKPNLIAYRPILGMDGDVARFDPTGLKFYTDRPERVAAIDHVSLIDHPGEYAVLADGRTAVAMLPPGVRTISIATGRSGFHVNGASHLVFRNLGFENMADGGKLTGGIGVLAEKAGSSDIAIENNRFRNFEMPKGQGPIILHDVDGVRIAGNLIESVSLGSGMRVSGAHYMIENNHIRRLGRTGIMLIGVDEGTVQHNVITDVLGVHGNGMSAYLDNHDIRFLANTVTDAKQPVTFHGAGQKATRDTNILFANNLFVANPDSIGSLISWGDWTRGVTIRNNVILGGKSGLRLSAKDSAVTLSDNVVSGLNVVGGQPSDWREAGNKWTSLSSQQRRKRDDAAPAAAAEISSASASLGAGKQLNELCAVILRHSLGQSAAVDTDKAIGAELTCP